MLSYPSRHELLPTRCGGRPHRRSAGRGSIGVGIALGTGIAGPVGLTARGKSRVLGERTAMGSTRNSLPKLIPSAIPTPIARGASA